MIEYKKLITLLIEARSIANSVQRHVHIMRNGVILTDVAEKGEALVTMIPPNKQLTASWRSYLIHAEMSDEARHELSRFMEYVDSHSELGQLEADLKGIK
jgi:hypothetical protein